ncbi:unnamed protein product [marine sediment metagenome]|uniref:Uncharacterized protein n=1 Tax=marine sediment metagenome TaxID=412755 RepID=X1L5X8_9ZZZZ
MLVKEIKNKEVWESFLLECQEKSFLDSWNWGEFNKAMGNKIWRLGIFEKNLLVLVILIVKTVAQRGTFLFVPHGPSTKYQVSSIKYQVLDKIKSL